MGKKYLETKKNSLESSVLGVWQTAIEEGDARMDGRTKQYKSHRSKLEAARLRREEKKKLNREEVELDEGKWKIGNSKKTGNFTAKNVEDAIAQAKKKGIKVDQEFSVYDRDKREWIYNKAMGKPYSEEVEIDEGTWALPKTPKQKAELKKLLSKPLKAKDASDKIYDIIGDDQLADDLDELADSDPNDDARDLVRSHMKRLGIKEEVELDEASGDKEAYKKFFDAALKKFKIDSPADLKSDEEKKKFYDYIDKNWEGDDEKAEQVKEFKMQSMRDALTQIWNVEEGKNPFKKEDHDDKKAAKKNKTETGKTPAVIDLKPKIDDK